MQPLPTARIRGTLAGLAVALVALAAAAGAEAHAVVQATQPANDAVVEMSPARVSVIYNEPVETAFGALRVYDSAAGRVDTGQLVRPSPDTVAVELEPDLPDGTYTVAWRVVSGDSHPIQGAFVFHVGAPGANAAGIADEVLAAGTPRTVSISFGVVRFVAFAALIAAAGGIVALLLFLRDAKPPVSRRLWTLVAGSAAVLALTGPPALVLQGASAGGLPLREAAEWTVVAEVLETRFGQVTLVRTLVAVLVVLAALALRSLGSRARDVEALTALAAAGLVVTPALAGHASVSGPLAVATDVAHVVAAAVWTGGLAFVVAALLFAGAERWPLATRCVPRFSTAAVVSVGVLVAAGAVNGYLQVRTWGALWGTTYGQLLLVKLALVVPLLGLGAFNNRFTVPRLRAGVASVLERRRFLRTAGAELGLVVAIVAVTAALVAEPPARAQAEAQALESRPRAELLAGPFHLELEARPGVAGPNDIVLDVVHGEEIDELTITASLPAEEIGPLRLTAEQDGPRRYVVREAGLAIPGVWELEVQVRQGEFDVFTETVSITIGNG